MTTRTTIRAGTISILTLLGLLAACGADNDSDGGAGGSGASTVSSGGTTSGSGGTTGGVGTGGGATGGTGGVANSGGSSTGGTGGAGTGGGTATGGSSASTNGDSELANFGTVREIALFACGFSDCHASGDKLKLEDDDELYSTLTTYVVEDCGHRVLVEPGTPEESAFWLVMQGECEDVPQMPRGCVDNCIPDEYIDGVGQWIAKGAPRE
jgi:hypothetical protein